MRRSRAVSAQTAPAEGKRAPSSWPLYGLVGTVALACYLNGLGGDFVHDDVPAVTLNRDVLALNPVGHSFKNDFWGTPMADVASHKSYRPLTVLTFRANYLCFGLQPVWFHATNVLLHAATCILFTRVCLSVAGLKPPFAALAGLLFAVHPVHTEAVTGIVGRADVLACVFFLVSLLAYHGHPDGRCHVWISVTLGGLSMLAKETGVSVFLLNLAYDLYRHWPAVKKTIVEVRWNRETQQFANRAAKVLTSLGILLAVRLALLQGSLPKFSQQDNPTAFHPSLYVRIMTFCYLAAFNWWLLLCPATLSHDWQMGSVPLLTSMGDPRNLLTCFFLGIAALLVIRSVSDFEGQKHVPVVLGLMLLVLPFLPATNLVVTVGFVVAERVLYIPSLGGTLLVVYGIQMLWNSYSKHRQTIVCCIMLLLTTSCLRTVIRNRDWRSRESLLRAGLMTLPHNAKMHYNYANFLRDSARPELAKSHYHRALKLWPTYASAHNNLGTLLSNEREAEQHFLAAIRYSVDHVNAHYNLGQLYSCTVKMQSRFDYSFRREEKRRIRETAASLHFAICEVGAQVMEEWKRVLLQKANRTSESERMLKRCINLEPRFTPAYIELARLKGPNDLTVGSLLEKVVTLNPRDSYYSTIHGHWLLDKGAHVDALRCYWKSLAASVSYQEAMLGASKILRKFGQHSRLFQLITRWQSILRIKKGEPPINPHVYLHGWRLKSELSHRAKAYDNCTTLLFGSRCVQMPSSSSKTKKSSEEVTNDWLKHVNNRTKNSTKYHGIKQCRVQPKLQKQRPTNPVMVHHFLD